MRPTAGLTARNEAWGPRSPGDRRRGCPLARAGRCDHSPRATDSLDPRCTCSRGGRSSSKPEADIAALTHPRPLSRRASRWRSVQSLGRPNRWHGNQLPPSPTMRVFAAGARGNVPTVVWGEHPGVGKTAKHSAYARAWVSTPRPWWVRSGWPATSWACRSRWTGRCAPARRRSPAAPSDANRALISFDELTTSAPSLSKAMLRIFQEREVGELRLPATAALVAAANRRRSRWTGGSYRRRSRTG